MYSRISVVGTRMTLANAGNGRHNLARRAIAALEGVVLEEGCLDRMQAAVCGRETFDGRDLSALGLRGERQAGKDALAIDMDGAGAALALIAALLGAGQRKVSRSASSSVTRGSTASSWDLPLISSLRLIVRVMVFSCLTGGIASSSKIAGLEVQSFCAS